MGLRGGGEMEGIRDARTKFILEWGTNDEFEGFYQRYGSTETLSD